MRLLQREIDATPGQSGEKIPKPGGVQKNAGVAALDLKNDCDRTNSFLVWIKAARPEHAWMEDLCRIAAVAEEGIEDRREGKKLKLTAHQERTRRVTIKVAAPLAPASRAGVYRMVAHVKSDYAVSQGATRRQAFEFPFDVAVRPYHAGWSLELEEKRRKGKASVVRFFRRRLTLWATVTNPTNDWLYVELELPEEEKRLSLERDVWRLAVPPADRKGAPASRRFPIRVVSRHRELRNDPIPTTVTLRAVRQDAPTVARFPLLDADKDGVVPALRLLEAVETETPKDEFKTASKQVVYYPPIPNRLRDLVRGARARAMSAIGLVLVLCALFYAASYAWEKAVHKLGPITVSAAGWPGVAVDRIAWGGALEITGSNLGKGDEVEVFKGDIEIVPASKNWTGSGFRIELPEVGIKRGDTIRVRLRRRAAFGLLPGRFLIAFPTSLDREVTVGEKPEAKPMEIAFDPPTAQIGKPLTISTFSDLDFGTAGVDVVLDSARHLPATGSGKRITVVVPNDKSLVGPGHTLTVIVHPRDVPVSKPLDIGEPPRTLVDSEGFKMVGPAIENDDDEEILSSARSVVNTDTDYGGLYLLYAKARKGELDDELESLHRDLPRSPARDDLDRALRTMADAAYWEAKAKDAERTAKTPEDYARANGLRKTADKLYESFKGLTAPKVGKAKALTFGPKAVARWKAWEKGHPVLPPPGSAEPGAVSPDFSREIPPGDRKPDPTEPGPTFPSELPRPGGG